MAKPVCPVPGCDRRAEHPDDDHASMLWVEDDCTVSDSDHEGVNSAYKRLFGVEFRSVDALRSVDHGDAEDFFMPNGAIVTISYPGNCSIERLVDVATDLPPAKLFKPDTSVRMEPGEKAYVEHAIVCETGCTPVSRCHEGERLFQRWTAPDVMRNIDGYLAGRSSGELRELGRDALGHLVSEWPKVPEAERSRIARFAVEYGRVIEDFTRWGVNGNGLMGIMTAISMVRAILVAGIPPREAIAKAGLSIPDDFLTEVLALLEADGHAELKALSVKA